MLCFIIIWLSLSQIRVRERERERLLQEEIERERLREQMAIERELQRRQMERELSRQHVILDEDEESLVERLKTLRRRKAEGAGYSVSSDTSSRIDGSRGEPLPLSSLLCIYPYIYIELFLTAV